MEELVSLNPKDSRDLEARTRYKVELEILRRKTAGRRQGVIDEYAAIRFERQVVLVGVTNTGKSTLLQMLTGSDVRIADAPYTTYKPEIGMLVYNDVPIQVIELPPLFAGDNDYRKYQFIRNADVLCVTARDAQTAGEAISCLEDHLIVLSAGPMARSEHKYRPKEDIIEKPALIIAGEHFESPCEVVNITASDRVGESIYQLLNIMRLYCFRNGNVEGAPIVFSREDDITLEDFARKLGKQRYRSAKIFGTSARYDGQQVGLSHRPQDGDRIWLQ